MKVLKQFVPIIVISCVFFTGMSFGKHKEIKHRNNIKRPVAGKASSSIIDKVIDVGFKIVMDN